MPEKSNCLFCRIAQKDIPAALIYESDDIVAFKDINPQAPTHILIIPRKHIATMNDILPEDAALLGRMTLVAKEFAAQEGIAQKGYRLVFNCNQDAGQAVFHIHLHLLGGRAFAWPPG